ncbi:uroporphyrinogen-III synthase [Bacillus aerolatus]|uniref:Uroporphyrinogen-III synthase n=1 Tax=Bacillus aerolatus TaxID=2653354 RepID=A0A6I1FIV1_9BACI|nr:uroporphyrinogen-III synthase [Bacillus aerolatus]KAB7708605.1 uroporphyrinogen-III synthase [Bacillus aerolatus]
MMSAGPLFGKHVLVTRPRGQAASFIDKIEAAGGMVHFVPLIAFRSFSDPNGKDRLQTLFTYDWIILTSKNGVDFFFQQLEKAGKDRADIQARFAAIGTETAAVLQTYGFQAEYIPEKFSADQFAKEITDGSFEATKVLIPKGNLARTMIADALRKKGMAADEWIVYETFFPEEEKARLIDLLQKERTDVITFTSPSSVRHFMKAAEEAGIDAFEQSVVACIGPVTKKEADRFGLHTKICPDVYTSESLAEAIDHYFRKEEN